MTLEESQRIAKKFIRIISKTRDTSSEWCGYDNSEMHEIKRAFESLLNYIENESISKEKVENKLEEIEEFETCVIIEEFQREAKIDVLKELLEK